MYGHVSCCLWGKGGGLLGLLKARCSRLDAQGSMLKAQCSRLKQADLLDADRSPATLDKFI